MRVNLKSWGTQCRLDCVHFITLLNASDALGECRGHVAGVRRKKTKGQDNFAMVRLVENH